MEPVYFDVNNLDYSKIQDCSFAPSYFFSIEAIILEGDQVNFMLYFAYSDLFCVEAEFIIYGCAASGKSILFVDLKMCPLLSFLKDAIPLLFSYRMHCSLQRKHSCVSVNSL